MATAKTGVVAGTLTWIWYPSQLNLRYEDHFVTGHMIAVRPSTGTPLSDYSKKHTGQSSAGVPIYIPKFSIYPGKERTGTATAFGVDARKEEPVVEFFERVEKEIGPIEVAAHNIGANVSIPVVDFEARKFFKIWEMACFSGFLLGREAARRMVTRKKGTILFTGATASTRGRQGMAGFAGAKHALRALAQSMARELGPQGIHVAHAIVDGPIDMPWIRENFPQLVEQRPKDGLLRALTGNFIEVALPAGSAQRGERIPVRVTDVTRHDTHAVTERDG